MKTIVDIFPNLKERHFEQKNINKIKSNQNILTDVNDSIAKQRHFYKHLYQTRPLMESDINFFNTPITQLTNDDHN